MKENIIDFRKNELITNISILIVGIILTIWPLETLNIAVNVVGSVIVLFGAANLVLWFINKGSNYVSLFIGILAFMIGVFVIIKSSVVISVIHMLLGVAILADGLVHIKTLIDFKNTSRLWNILFIISTITILFGLLWIFNPLFVADMNIRIGGIIMIFCSLEGLFINYKVRKIIK